LFFAANHWVRDVNASSILPDNFESKPKVQSINESFEKKKKEFTAAMAMKVQEHKDLYLGGIYRSWQ